MSIGRNEQLAKHVSVMPADSLALYRLSRLPADVFTEAVDAGLITRKTGRKQAQRLVTDWRAAEDAGADRRIHVKEFISLRAPRKWGDEPQGPLAPARIKMQWGEVDRIKTMSSGWLLDDWLDDVTEVADDRLAFVEAVEAHRDALAQVNLTARTLLHLWPLGRSVLR